MGLIGNLLHAAWEWNNRPRAMTSTELVILLRRMQADEATPGEWDYFQALAVADPRLEAIRRKVAPLYGPGFFPATSEPLAVAISQAEAIMAADDNREVNGS